MNDPESPEETAAVTRLCLRLGRITYHWNLLHGLLQQIFAFLIGDWNGTTGSMSPGLELWQSQKSDDGQRTLLKVYSETKLKSDPDLKGLLHWILDEAAKLSTYRNDAIHVIFYFNSQDRAIQANPMLTAESRSARINTTGHSELFDALLYDLLVLEALANRVLFAILAPQSRPEIGASLKSRLELRSARLVAESPPGNPTRQSPPVEQPDPPPSSQA